MKAICEKCLMKDKSKEACIKRLCGHADLPPPPPLEPIPESPWHIEAEDLIEATGIRLLVDRIDDDGNFVGQIVEIDDADQNPGHFGSYVSLNQYYQFKIIDKEDPAESLIWEIPDEGTDRFHRDGRTGAQFLLYWFKDTGFSFDIDS